MEALDGWFVRVRGALPLPPAASDCRFSLSVTDVFEVDAGIFMRGGRGGGPEEGPLGERGTS